MAQSVTEIDQLIEQGLSRYGEGELDEALLLWERVLAIDPDNAQANSYVDYVRMNYELLTGEGNTEHSGPFGIGDDEPEYQIEILPGDVVEPAVAAPLYMDTHDGGWAIGDECASAPPASPSTMTVELEADEPPVGGDPGTFESPHTGEVSFEDATREYHGGAGRPASTPRVEAEAPASTEFVSEVTPGFGSPEDRSQTTDVRRRDLGFVQPTDAEPRVAPAPPELKVSVRTPGSQVIPVPSIEPDTYRAPPAARERRDVGGAGHDEEPGFELETPPAGFRPGAAYASLNLDLAAGTDDQAALDLDLVGRADTRPAVIGVEHELTPPRPIPRAPVLPAKPAPAKPRSPAADVHPPNESTTRGLPLPATLLPELGIAAAPTQEMSPAMLDPLLAGHRSPPPPTEPPPDFGDNPTNQIASRMGALRSAGPLGPNGPNDPVISAPTRQLGLRNERRAATEEETTGHFEFPPQRVAPRGSGKLDVMGIDPIDARSAEILEEVDRDAPANEPREDRTRRRITALLERATAWGQRGDLERSVTAVDLALSEDPNSALAQKLIHRNRDTIMNAFQGFLGDLQRTPALARPLHELGSAPISPRAAFLLSRVDGTLSLDEILDVSGMPRLEAYRYLCQLFLRGILR